MRHLWGRCFVMNYWENDLRHSLKHLKLPVRLCLLLTISFLPFLFYLLLWIMYIIKLFTSSVESKVVRGGLKHIKYNLSGTGSMVWHSLPTPKFIFGATGKRIILCRISVVEWSLWFLKWNTTLLKLISLFLLGYLHMYGFVFAWQLSSEVWISSERISLYTCTSGFLVLEKLTN